MSCSERQGTLDNVITKQPRVPPFTPAGLLDYIIELVVSEDNVRTFSCLAEEAALNSLKAFQLVDKGPFRRLLTYVRPSLLDKDIPHRTKLRKEIFERAEAVEERVRVKLQVTFIFRVYSSLKLTTVSEYSWASFPYFRHMDFRQWRAIPLGHGSLC
jgi:hypothetical protein